MSAARAPVVDDVGGVEGAHLAGDPAHRGHRRRGVRRQRGGIFSATLPIASCTSDSDSSRLRVRRPHVAGNVEVLGRFGQRLGAERSWLISDCTSVEARAAASRR